MAGEGEFKVDVPDSGGQSDYTPEGEKLTLDILEGKTGPKSEATPKEDEGKPKEGAGGEPPKGKVPYTPQELEALLQSDATLDTDRLSLEGRALMKSFQRGNEQKLQEIAATKRRLEGEAQRALDPREKVFRDYMQNPAQILTQINAEIRKFESVSPVDEKYVEARQTIAALNELKDDLAIRRQQTVEVMRSQETTFARAQNEILSEIPDFATKAEKLTGFAIEAGLTREEIMALSDPTIFGPMAVKLTKAMNKLYDKVNAGKSSEQKVKKDAPLPLARAGSGGSLEEEKEKAPGDMSMIEYRTWREKKKK